MLYTKPGCCLCDGLKETLDAILNGDAEVPTLAQTLKTMPLEIRDVSTNDEWAQAYAMEVPVLALVTTTNTTTEGDDDDEDETAEEENEVQLPRPAPRLSPSRLAIRLSQDVKAAMAGENIGARKGWSMSDGGGGGGDDGTKEKPKQGSGGGWAVVSENPF